MLPFLLLPEEEDEGSKAGEDMEDDEVQIGAPTLIILGGFRRAHRLSSGRVVPRLTLTTEQASTALSGAHRSTPQYSFTSAVMDSID